MAQKSTGVGDRGHELRQAVYPVITPSLVQFQRTLSKANFDFNTVRVGLVRLAQDQTSIKVNFAVAWNPHDMASAVDEAQAYATNSFLVYAVDGVDAYMRGQASKPSALNGEAPKSIIRGDFQASAPRKPVSQGVLRELEAALWAPGADQGAVLSEFREVYIGRSHRRDE